MMRLVVVATDSDGCSCVGSDGPPLEYTLVRSGADALTAPRETLRSMPDHVRDGETAVARLVVDGRIARHPTPAARAESLDLPPGGSRWSIVTFGPGVDAELHETATIDYDLILSGSVDLLLDKGEVRLSTGDAVVIPGARHGWRTTDEACQMTVVMCSPEGGAA